MGLISSKNIGIINKIFTETKSYFKQAQNTDGGFPYNEVGSPSGAWTTAGVLWALTSINETINEAFILDAFDYLIETQSEEGSIPVTDKGGIGCIDATSQFIIAAGAMYSYNQDNKILNAIEKAYLWLCNISSNGSWGTTTNTEPIVSSTSSALIALKSIEPIFGDSKITNTILAGVNWLVNIKNDDNGWGIYKGNATKGGTTAFALIAISACLPDELDFKREIIRNSQNIILSKQLKDGNWPDIIERKAGFTVIRIGNPYCLISLITSGYSITQIKFQKGLNYLLKSFNNGRYIYQDSDIVTWSTRDGLLALSYIRSNVINSQLIELFDQNILREEENENLYKKIQLMSDELDLIKRNEKEKINKIVENKINNLRGYFNFLKALTCILLFLLFTCIFYIIKSSSQATGDQVFILIGIMTAFWGTLCTFIISKKFS